MNRNLSIIYFKDNTGRARTLELPIKRLVLLLAGLCLLILVSIISFVFSVKMYVDKGRLAAELASLSQEKELLEARVKNMEANSVGTNTGSTERAAPKSEASKVDLHRTATAKTLEEVHVKGEGEKAAGPISLNGFHIKSENNQLTVSFNLINIINNSAAAHGYVFIIGDYGGAYLSFPEDAELRDGIPVDFKKGDSFAIKRQKHIEQILPLSTNDTIKKIAVFVYSAEGELLIKKEISPVR